MIVPQFLAWVQTASAGARAEATSALARAYLYSDFDDRDRDEAQTALTAMLDDPSPLVRRSLAEAFASAPEAPRPCISALAADQSDIASIVLARSPLLMDAELIDCARNGDAFAQAAIALRPKLSAAVATVIAEVGAPEALISLAVNVSADVREAHLRRMLERAGDNGEVRESILCRPDLSPALRADLVAATADALSAFVIACDWMSADRARRMASEATEKGVVAIAASHDGGDDVVPMVRRLRQSKRLTPALALRALLSGDRSLFEAMLVELAGVAPLRVAGIVGRPDSAGFAALYARAALPSALLPAFRMALLAQHEGDPGGIATAGALSRPLIERVRIACEKACPDDASVMALLRRLEAEAAREAARLATRRLVAAQTPVFHGPARLIEIDLASIEAELVATTPVAMCDAAA